MTTAAVAPQHGWRAAGRASPGMDAVRHSERRIAINATTSQVVLPWLSTVVERLNSVGALAAGWDGEAAKPPTREAAVAALRALFEVMSKDTPAPAVVPMYDGGLQVEWHGVGTDIELTIAPDGERRVWVCEASGLEIDAEFRHAAEDLRKLLGVLSRA